MALLTGYVDIFNFDLSGLIDPKDGWIFSQFFQNTALARETVLTPNLFEMEIFVGAHDRSTRYVECLSTLSMIQGLKPFF